MRRVETGETFVEEIPVEFFQETLFNKKLYLDKAVEIVLKGLDVFDVGYEEPIRVCTGYVLSRVRQVLRERGYRVVPAKIVGETQRMAEEAFLNSLKKIGVYGASMDAGKRRFFSLLKWVQQDLRGREKYVKTGWRYWKRFKEREESGSKA